MIAEEPRIVDINGDHWRNLMRLIGGEGQVPPERKRSWALVLTRNGAAVKAIHSERGAIRGYELPPSGRLRRAARELQVDRLAVCEVDAFARIFDAANRAPDYDEDLAKQAIDLANAGFAAGRQEIRWYPRRPFRWRRLSYRRAQRILGWLVPDGRTLALVVFDGDGVHTSLILGKEEGHLSLMTTLDSVDLRGLKLDRWRGEVPPLLERIAGAHGRVHAGLFLQRRTFEEMRAGPRPLRFLLEARARGTAVIRPFPFRLRLVLGLLVRLRIV